MRILQDDDKEEALAFLLNAKSRAELSPCLLNKIGSVLVKRSEIIGEGYNSPPLDEPINSCYRDQLPNGRSDSVCCVRAEQRAMVDALVHSPNMITGSTLYTVKLNDKGEIEQDSELFSTIISKMALDIGVANIVFFNRGEVVSYKSNEYNAVSFHAP